MAPTQVLARIMSGAILLLCSAVHAQWITNPLPSNGTFHAAVRATTISGYIFFASARPTGGLDYTFYASEDDGASWLPLSIPGYPNPNVVWAGARSTDNDLSHGSGDLY